MTAYCCDKLCSGECCAPLRSGLAMRTYGPFTKIGRDDCPILKASGAAILDALTTMHAVYAAIDDPAKLAELGAMALRARGIPSDTDFPATNLIDDPPTWVIRASEETINIVRNDDIVILSLAEFRAFVAHAMATPPDESSREQSEQLIRGET